MSASIRDRLIALALYRTVSAAAEDDETQPYANARPIGLLERLYRLRLVSAGVLWRGG
jgi:hypothetical protein